MAGSLFAVPKRPGRDSDSKIAKKVNSKPKKSSSVSVKGAGGLFERINTIRALVDTNLGKFRDEYAVIRQRDLLAEYMDAAKECGEMAIDTETTGLDPMLDNVVGVCIYVPGKKSAYIPIHHRSYITGEILENQLSKDVVHDEMAKLEDPNIKIIMFNACFDIRVIRNQIGVYLSCYWDCFLAARLLNENEGPGNNGLKALHQKYVLDGVGDAFRFDDLFAGISFDLIPINTAYLYAAHDPIITYELYKFQEPYLSADNEECISRGLTDIAWVFRYIEMPCVPVVADMEDAGVAFDPEYASQLHDKYHAELKRTAENVYDVIHTYDSEIAEYRAHHVDCKLSEPINIDSPVQISILLYDIIGVKSVDQKSPRGTGEEILSKMDIPLASALLEYRAVGKLIGTYIDKLPKCVNPNDKRIHCKFNQYGADTGRFSSQDPNLQNIPSHNKDIRKMFRASDGYVLMSSDYSQQEQAEFIKVNRWHEVETPAGWSCANDLKVGDKIRVTEDGDTLDIPITKIEYADNKSHLLLFC